MVKQSFRGLAKQGRCIPCLHEACRWCDRSSPARTDCNCPCEGKEFERAEKEAQAEG